MQESIYDQMVEKGNEIGRNVEIKKERNKLSKETTALSNLQANITQRKGGGGKDSEQL